MHHRASRWLCGRVPARRNPGAAHHHSDDVVELECDDGRTTRCGSTDDLGSIGTPEKVARPALLSGVEEPHALTGQRINCVCLCALEVIAHPTGQPQVRLVIGAAACGWDGMLNLQGAEHQVLRTAAVAAAVAGSGAYARTDCLRNGWTYGARGSRRPRRTASCNAWALRSSPS